VKDDIKNLITSYISNSPFISIISGSGISVLSSECTFSIELWGSNIVFDFCQHSSIVSIFGGFFILICTIRAFFISFGVEG
jgi:hypothetical protein